MKEKKSDADWWDYMIKAHSVCYNDFTEDCSKMIHSRLGLDFNKTQKCVDDSFTNKNTEDEDNSVLGGDFEFWETTGYAMVPSVLINDIKYQGDFAPTYIFEAICAGFANPPDECDIDVNPSIDVAPTAKRSHVKFNWFVLIICIIIIFNIILVGVCIKRNKNQLKLQVMEAIGKHSQYKQFDRGSNTL